MRDLNEAYIAELRHAIVQAICEVSAARQGEQPAGQPKTLYIGSAEVCQTLTILLAEFLEGVPGLNTPADVRGMSETVAKKLRMGIAEIRQLRAETGGKPLPSVIIRPD